MRKMSSREAAMSRSVRPRRWRRDDGFGPPFTAWKLLVKRVARRFFFESLILVIQSHSQTGPMLKNRGENKDKSRRGERKGVPELSSTFLNKSSDLFSATPGEQRGRSETGVRTQPPTRYKRDSIHIPKIPRHDQ
ncbi:hypothetical protein M440DRAFT_1134691 [Trichoderma longibrachiatum ATCC 18648]|uniref:Uncharacterized protein n=1 Tax=Trichoderma longibrachiatum ATCC 18648 TaxID=983965 RepID=A0A2T4CGS4_TRILO|nr:hypothetical protein M440DRAFT_1134691 [Trichoderma longibrachiatum ATCC 18648]